MNVARKLVTNLSTTVNEQRVMLVEMGAQVATSNESLSEANEALEVQRVDRVRTRHRSMLTVNSGQPKQSQKRRASTTRKLRKQAERPSAS